MLTVGNGALLTWGSDPLATVEQATAYATARKWADWLALDPSDAVVAILDASTYIKISYPAPYSYSAAQGLLIQNAAIEAARLTLSGPLIGAVEEPQILEERLKDLQTKFAEVKPGSALNSRLGLVSAMLRAAGLAGGSTINVPLRKA